MTGLGGQSTMRHRAVLRQGRICAILLGAQRPIGAESKSIDTYLSFVVNTFLLGCKHTRFLVKSNSWQSI